MPNQLRWLRLFALAGAIAPEFPLTGKTKTLLFEPDRNQSHYGYLYSADVLHWAFAVEFSTLYLTSRFTGGPPKEEPLNQLVPLIEFPVDTTIKGGSFTSAATMNPGLSYVGVVYQIAAEAIVPLDRQGGHSVGVTAGLELFPARSDAIAFRPTRLVLSQLLGGVSKPRRNFHHCGKYAHDRVSRAHRRRR